ncbi:class I SAM-dependent methyltransferase [bacterium]|nr:class I SAM-dependent methyltransferase [bacterium]
MSRLLQQFDPRWSFFRSVQDDSTILELGCGRGENIRAIEGLKTGVTFVGIDLLDEEDVPQNITYHKINLESEPLPYRDAHFDHILFVHVIEHIHDLKLLSQEIQRVLKPGGTVYIETPNFTSIFVPSFGYRRDQRHPFNFFDDRGHVRPWTKQSLYEFTRECGVDVIKLANTRNWLRLPFDILGIIYGLLTGNRPRIVRHFWNLYGWNIYAVGRKVT